MEGTQSVWPSKVTLSLTTIASWVQGKCKGKCMGYFDRAGKETHYRWTAHRFLWGCCCIFWPHTICNHIKFFVIIILQLASCKFWNYTQGNWHLSLLTGYMMNCSFSFPWWGWGVTGVEVIWDCCEKLGNHPLAGPPAIQHAINLGNVTNARAPSRVKRGLLTSIFRLFKGDCIENQNRLLQVKNVELHHAET